MESTKEDQIYLIARREACGDLTPVQYDWWLCRFQIDDDQFIKIYRKRAAQDTIKHLQEMCIELMFIATTILSIAICVI
jgi:hypothetical protein